ncbi:MAG: CPBP family intramembrane metalloprotease [Candidatus Heimdallarchaeota archaeon]|nr:CPBP family intramembrane metalloprotease [Candidatus Heimdallarchaeota archaeon]
MELHNRKLIRNYVVVPAIISGLLYGLLSASILFYTTIFNNEGLAFVLQIATFSLFTIYIVPFLIEFYYRINIWEILHIERVTWIYITAVALIISLIFIDTNESMLGNLLLSKSGLGKLSYGSLVMAPVFEEFLFRGVLLSLSSRVFSKTITIRLNGILFAIWHVGIVFSYGFIIQVPLIIILTGVFGYFLAHFQFNHRNLWISIILHSLANIFLATTGFLIPK